MLRSIGLSLASALVFYLLAAFVGGWLLMEFSSNRHDRQVEAAMTGAFVVGPAAAIIAFIVSFAIRSACLSSSTFFDAGMSSG